MGLRYGTTGFQTPVAAAAKSMLELLGTAGVIISVYDLMVGASGTPADTVLTYSVDRATVTGTGTPVTPEPLDAAIALAATGTAEEDHTVEPTIAGIPVIELPVNQRASYRWVAAPGGELKAALGTSGWAFRVKSASYVGQAEVSVHHEE